MDENRPWIMDAQVVLPGIFPPTGSRVRVPAPGGGYNVTWTMGEARTVGGVIKIKCVGVGYVPAILVQKK